MNEHGPGARICVTLGRERLADLLAAHRRLVHAGARLVEWRLDVLREPIDLAELFAKRPGPVVVTIRRSEDGGRWTGSEVERLRLLQGAVAGGAEYVDLEPDAAAKIDRSPQTRRIVSMHDFDETPDDLDAIHARLAAAGADVVKLATMARSNRDNTRMLRLVRTSRLPTIGLCMGELGAPSRILMLRAGAPFSYAAADDGEPLAPGQFGFRQMRELYRAEDLKPDTPVFGVIGDPIAHSHSPLVHNRALAALDLPGVYLPFRVPPAELDAFLADARELGLSGLSVTIPHKEAVLAHVARAHDPVTAIGAANTLVFTSDGIEGYNTDEPAALESLSAACGDVQRDDFARLAALILGAGGAAKAIAYGLRQRGAAVTITSKTAPRARQLAEPLGASTVDWAARQDGRHDIVVNCTPLGMSPHVGDSPFEAQALRPGMVVFDTVYNPEATRLVREARAVGCRVVTGIEMFVRQAARQFELFTGRPAPLDVMREALRQQRPAVSADA